jgi:hypothetical protein
VLPPSIHPDTGKPYEANANLWEVMERIPALGVDIEQRLREALGVKGVGTARPSLATKGKAAGVSGARLYGNDGLERWVSDELNEAVAEVGSAAPGTRNDTLFRVSARMAEHVTAAGFDWAIAAEALEAAAQRAGLAPGEASATVESGHKRGSENPTEWIRTAGEFIFLGRQDRFYHTPSGSYYTEHGFNAQFCHLHFGKERFSTFLLQNELIVKVSDITYDPRNAERFIEVDGARMYNSYRAPDIVPMEGDATPFKEFLSYLVPHEVERDHLINVIAHMVRNPGEKVRHAIMLGSPAQGIGKSMLVDIICHLLGKSNTRKTDSHELGGRFKSYIPGNLLIFCEELNLGQGKTVYNGLKDIISNDEAIVDEKGLIPRMWPNYATLWLLTNLDTPLLIENDDRRIFYIRSTAQRREPDYYTRFVSWWRSNLPVIRYYLNQVDLLGFNPSAPPPMTNAKADLIAASRHDLVAELDEKIASRSGSFRCDLVTLDQVYVALGMHGRDRKRSAVVRALKSYGAENLGQSRVGQDRESLWAIRNVEFWSKAPPAYREVEWNNPGQFEVLNDAGIEIVFDPTSVRG